MAVMTIQVFIKDVYVQEMIYPSCEKAKLFAAIAGTKTLTRDTLTLIKKLGYEVERVTPDVKL
jgi:hypothetical protein